MTYYYVQYIVHSPPNIPIEKEDWISTEDNVTELQLMQLLGSGDAEVSFVVCHQVSQEDYESKCLQPPMRNKFERQEDSDNVDRWNLEENSRVAKKLSDESDATDSRFRNIDDPGPLL